MRPLMDHVSRYLNLPLWLVPALFTAAPPILGTVQVLLESGDALSNERKFSLAARSAGKALDSAFDEVPEWRGLDEHQRDAIISGLVELALFAAERRAARKEKRHEQSS